MSTRLAFYSRDTLTRSLLGITREYLQERSRLLGFPS